MSETLFPIEPAKPELTIAPGDSQTVRLTKRRDYLMANGYHPMGGKLLHPMGETCKTCRHAASQEYAKTYWKCALTKWTKGPGSDIRLKWPACTKWEAKEETK